MPRPARDDPPPTGAEPDLSGFGFELPEGTWLQRVRQANRPLPPGRIGGFELLEEVSRGAQGVVYRARQPNTRRIIAVKRLVAGSYATPAMRLRFEREVEAAAGLSHPNIVTVYGLDLSDGQPLLAMEWIEGEPVDRWAAQDAAGRPRPPADRLRMFLRICDAVHYAHQRGVIHRDLKPSNILVDARGEPHVLDFGLAKLVSR
ncbi:MAG: serine/threonine protein kinase, partial [Planctomycetes bacterium]|nr:serine/threonine protein kinase [Planctomycetota bacterium]